MDTDLLPLSEVIRVLRAELTKAMTEARHEAVRFELGVVEFEINVVITPKSTGKAQASFKVLGWGGEGDLGEKAMNQRVQKLKIVLNPTESQAHVSRRK